MSSLHEQVKELCRTGMKHADAIIHAFEDEDVEVFEIEHNVSDVRRIRQLRIPATISAEENIGMGQLVRQVRPYLQAVFSFAHAGMSQSRKDFPVLRKVHVPKLAEILIELKKFWPASRDSASESSTTAAIENMHFHSASMKVFDNKLRDLMLSHETLKAQSEFVFETLDEDLVPLREKYNEALKYYENTKSSFEYRISKLDEMLSTSSKKVLSHSYDDQSQVEEQTADFLRWAALGIMLLMVGVVGFSLIETAKNELSVTAALLRFGFIMVLSLPAAYLARESAKHRQRQYSLKQTALDVAAIDPYIANLPAEIKNKIKQEIASKLFAPKNFDLIHKKDFPINAQEILMRLLDVAVEKRTSDKKRSETGDKSEE